VASWSQWAASSVALCGAATPGVASQARIRYPSWRVARPFAALESTDAADPSPRESRGLRPGCFSCRATRTAPPGSRRSSNGGLADSRKVNDHRGLLGYTGTYKGVPISVQTSGMGAPSMSIVVEELIRLGAQKLIRVGTCGGIARGLETG